MRALWRAIRSFRWQEWGALLLAAVLAAGVGVLAYVVIDAAQARQQATEQAQAQRDQAIDARKAQTRRIDQLTYQVDGLREVVEGQARTIGRQEQAIRDLSEQVHQAGGTPVVTSVVPRRDARTSKPTPGATSSSSSSPRPRATSSPTTAPKPTRPAPSPTSDDGLLCGLLVLIC